VKPDDSDDRPIQVDIYGVRTSISPRPDQRADPDTWRAVARRLNLELMSITTNTFVLLGQTLKSAISLVRGIGNLPSSVNDRISRAHGAADLAELSSARRLPSSLGPMAARAQLQSLVTKLESRGLKVVIVEREERVVVAVLQAVSDDDVQQIVGGALQELEAAAGDLPCEGRSHSS
jgi:hypothetical protein